MWTIKYRPKDFSEIVGNKPIITRIQAMFPNLPHMLFRGPPGVGKTTTALVIAKKLGCNYKELNASDERKIDDVREVVKNFMSTPSIDGKRKLLILDEGDAMTSDAQGALRRLMEKYEHNCIVIITCNKPEKIIEPIHSRCQGGNFEFQPITLDEFKPGIRNILTKENVTITDDALEYLYYKCNGDMRVIDKLYGLAASYKNINIKEAKEIEDDETWKEVLKLIKENKYPESCLAIKKSHIIPIFLAIHQDKDIDEDKKKRISRHIAEWDFRRQFAVTEFIQLYAIVANIMAVLNEKPKNELKGLGPVWKK